MSQSDLQMEHVSLYVELSILELLTKATDDVFGYLICTTIEGDMGIAGLSLMTTKTLWGETVTAFRGKVHRTYVTDATSNGSLERQVSTECMSDGVSTCSFAQVKLWLHR